MLLLAIDKMDKHGVINTAHHERLPKKTEVMWYYLATEGLPERWSASVIKMNEQMHNDAFKRRLHSLQLHR